VFDENYTKYKKGKYAKSAIGINVNKIKKESNNEKMNKLNIEAKNMLLPDSSFEMEQISSGMQTSDLLNKTDNSKVEKIKKTQLQ
jgi:hypothetical protein